MATYYISRVDKGRGVKVGRAAGRIVNLSQYEVIDANGKLVGYVFRDMATFERRSPGRMWVTDRWKSPRWFYRIGTSTARSRMFYETRLQAIESLLHAAENLK